MKSATHHQLDMLFLPMCDPSPILCCRLGLAEKLQLACTEKKGRAQAIQIDGASVMLPTGNWPRLSRWFSCQ